ncbi:MAG: alpha/beta fold hydrolase [Ferrimicrobium sp.]
MSRVLVVFLHGQPGRGRDFRYIQERLPSRFHVLAPDRPGWGDSPFRACGVGANVDWLVQEINARRGSDRVIVVGHSFGAAIAVLASHRYPDLFSGVVLVSPAATASAVIRVDAVLRAPILGHIGAHLVVAGAERHPMPPPRGRSRTSFLFEQYAFEREISEVERALSALPPVVSVVVGARDRIVPPRASLDVIDRVRPRQLAVIPNVGHDLPRRAPGTVALAIVALMADVDSNS